MCGCARADMCVRAAAFPAITHTWHINCCRNSRSLKVSVLSGLEFFFLEAKTLFAGTCQSGWVARGLPTNPPTRQEGNGQETENEQGRKGAGGVRG